MTGKAGAPPPPAQTFFPLPLAAAKPGDLGWPLEPVSGARHQHNTAGACGSFLGHRTKRDRLGAPVANLQTKQKNRNSGSGGPFCAHTPIYAFAQRAGPPSPAPNPHTTALGALQGIHRRSNGKPHFPFACETCPQGRFCQSAGPASTSEVCISMAPARLERVIKGKYATKHRGRVLSGCSCCAIPLPP